MYYAVIMAGGSGTRLWPLSRKDNPKQALKLVGDRTMFQYAVERITPIFPLERILVITGADHAAILKGQVPDLPGDNFILEPEGRGTAPAIGLAALHIAIRDPQAVMCVLTADHYIKDPETFCNVLTAAGETAGRGSLVTLGIHPRFASPGYGYIQQGSLVGEMGGFEYFSVVQFTEKPDPTTAERMVSSGNYSWNSGMFIWRVDRIMDEFKDQMSEFYRQLMEVKTTVGTPQYQSSLDHIWPLVRKETIDFGVMEGARDVVVFPVEIGWYDIGSWDSLNDLIPVDENGNISVGNHLALDTERTLVFGGDRLIATLGVEDLIIIDTEDALLVCSRDHEQDVKEIVARLKAEGEEGLL